MRSILIALSLGVAAASVAYAHTADGSAPVKQAGTLTCRTLTDVGLVFGKTRAAACTYRADGRDFSESYGALLPPRADDEGMSYAITWRVMTAGGASRPGMLDGAFGLGEPGAVLRGKGAVLEPTGEAIEANVTFAANGERRDIGALDAVKR